MLTRNFADALKVFPDGKAFGMPNDDAAPLVSKVDGAGGKGFISQKQVLPGIFGEKNIIQLSLDDGAGNVSETLASLSFPTPLNASEMLELEGTELKLISGFQASAANVYKGTFLGTLEDVTVLVVMTMKYGVEAKAAMWLPGYEIVAEGDHWVPKKS